MPVAAADTAAYHSLAFAVVDEITASPLEHPTGDALPRDLVVGPVAIAPGGKRLNIFSAAPPWKPKPEVARLFQVAPQPL